MGIQLEKNAQIGNETRKNTKDGFLWRGGNELGNSSSRKSKESGGTIVIVDDATQDKLSILAFASPLPFPVSAFFSWGGRSLPACANSSR